MNNIATSSRWYYFLSEVSMNWAKRGPADRLKFFLFLENQKLAGVVQFCNGRPWADFLVKYKNL
jgi:hypothetical protein